MEFSIWAWPLKIQIYVMCVLCLLFFISRLLGVCEGSTAAVVPPVFSQAWMCASLFTLLLSSGGAGSTWYYTNTSISSVQMKHCPWILLFFAAVGDIFTPFCCVIFVLFIWFLRINWEIRRGGCGNTAQAAGGTSGSSGMWTLSAAGNWMATISKSCYGGK